MSDLFTEHYFGQAEGRFLAFVVAMLRQILTSDRCMSQIEVQAAKNLVDIMEGWLPLHAGNGSITLEVFGHGRLRIQLYGANLGIDYRPWRRTTPSMRFKTMFFTSQRQACLGMHFTDFHADLTMLLNVAASLSGADFETRGMVLVKWNPGPKPIPAPGQRWVKLRERARQKNDQPPRACHWLADINQNKENPHV